MRRFPEPTTERCFLKMDSHAWTGAAELAAAIRSKELSPVELMDAVLARIDARNPGINALIYVAYDHARLAARKAEDDVMSQRTLGPLHGVPTAIKDLFDSKPGWPYTLGGIRALKDNVGNYTCAWAERMEAAGAIVLGKTNSPVLGFRGTCDNYLFGPSRNPFDLSRNTGGSSGGGAATVADGLLPFAEGTDGGGSNRIPASWCGVYGFKQSWGRGPFVSRPNGFIGTAPYLAEGFLTRSVQDAALGLSALAGYHPRDSLSLPLHEDFTRSAERSVKELRIAYSPDLGGFPVRAEVSRVVAEGAKALESITTGVDQVQVRITGEQLEGGDLWCRMTMPLTLDALDQLKTQGFDLLGASRQDLPPEFQHWVEQGQALTRKEITRDQITRTQIYDAIQDVFEDYDLLITPTLSAVAVPNATDGNTVGPAEINGVRVNELIGWCLTYPINFTGHPAASVPVGFADGLPVGMQIIGRRYADGDVLAASRAIEEVRPWAQSYQICETRSQG